MWKISAKLSAMLNNLPRESQRLFGEGPITSMKTTFIKARRRLAAKLQNPLKTRKNQLPHFQALEGNNTLSPDKRPLLRQALLGAQVAEQHRDIHKY
jgi:hypothetical protein